MVHSDMQLQTDACQLFSRENLLHREAPDVQSSLMMTEKFKLMSHICYTMGEQHLRLNNTVKCELF